MKVRFYLLDYSTYTDVEWNCDTLPKLGEEIFVNEFLDLNKDELDIIHIFDFGETCYSSPLSRLKSETVDEYWDFKKRMRNLRVLEGAIWRKINNEITPCFLLAKDNLTDIPDALKSVEDYNKYTN